MEQTEIFLSWSGQASKLIASELHEWLPHINQNIRPFFSDTDIGKGAKWASVLEEKLNTIVTGLFCLTKENLMSPWMLFEAGVLSAAKSGGARPRICALLFGVEIDEMPSPYSAFQVTHFNRDDFQRLLIDVNNLLGQFAIAERLFLDHFDVYWPRLEESIKGIISATNPQVNAMTKPSKSDWSCNAEGAMPQVLGHLSDISDRLTHIEAGIINRGPAFADPSYENGRFFNRTSLHHMLVHQARDLAVELMGDGSIYAAPQVLADSPPQSHPRLEMCRTPIVSMLEKVSSLFEFTVPEGVRVWTCLRDRRADDSYHTFARAGRYNPNREGSSSAMHKDSSVTILRLKDSYKGGTCVMITGSTMGPQMWEPQQNDKFAEDKCVLMGAVLTKSFAPEVNTWTKRKLAWILSVNATSEDAFTQTQVPLMQCCVDVFSWVANTILRSHLDSLHHS